MTLPPTNTANPGELYHLPGRNLTKTHRKFGNGHSLLLEHGPRMESREESPGCSWENAKKTCPVTSVSSEHRIVLGLCVCAPPPKVQQIGRDLLQIWLLWENMFLSRGVFPCDCVQLEPTRTLLMKRWLFLTLRVQVIWIKLAIAWGLNLGSILPGSAAFRGMITLWESVWSNSWWTAKICHENICCG